jgi:hypothetical protein
MKCGLEICGFAAVDIAFNTAFHINAIQTPLLVTQILLQYYCQIIKENHLYFKELSNYLVADAYFAKKEVADTILPLGMHFISRVQKNVVLYYINQEPPTGKKGAPKKICRSRKSKRTRYELFQIMPRYTKVKNL